MPVYSFPEWAPDKSRLNGQASAEIKNVIPVQDGYGPMNGIDQFSDALPAACKGAKLAISTDGTAHVFAGTQTGLYKLSNSTWEDVSGASAPYNLADEDFWSIAQDRDNVLFTNINDPIQKFELQVDVDFSDLTGSPPQCKFICTESGYVTLGHTSDDERAVRRSGYKSPSFWTIGHRGADQEIFSDGGLVQGFAPDSTGTWVFQDRRIRRLENVPGQEVSFSISDVDPTRGTGAPNSIVQWGPNSVEFLSEDGFYKLGNPSIPIGAERIDRTFLDDVDLSRLYEVQGVPDPIRRMNWWRYSSKANAGNAYTDKLIGHHWYLDKWVHAEIQLEWLCPAALPAYTLEEMETQLGYATLEVVPYTLDSRVWKGGRPAFAGFDADHKLGFFEGDYLEALLDAADIPGPEGYRHYINGFRIVGDTTGAYGSLWTKETLHGTPMQTSEVIQSTTGMVSIRGAGRTIRPRVRVPSSAWGSNPVISAIEVPQHNMRQQAGRR